MNNHFGIWVAILAIPAVGIMIAIIGKWLFTPMKPTSNWESINPSKNYNAPPTKQLHIYKAKMAKHDVVVH